MTGLPAGLRVAVRAPASSANLGPGFDAVGLGLALWDEYVVELTGDRLDIRVTGEGFGEIPCDASHLVYRCLTDGLRDLGFETPPGLLLHARNAVPHSRGLGSSATAIVAGYALASALARLAAHPDLPPGADVRLDLAWVNDRAAEVEGHPDNSSASVYGGLTVSVTDDTGTHTVHVDAHPEVDAIALVPTTRLATSTARAVLPELVPLSVAARNGARVGLLVEALSRRPDLLLVATVDLLHQEARRPSYPDSMALVDALRADGLAAVISGAGPTVLVLVDRARREEVVARELPTGWRALAPGISRAGVCAFVPR